jgi:hypothetical protein
MSRVMRVVLVAWNICGLTCWQDPPEGFTGDADVWSEDTEGFGLSELAAWLCEEPVSRSRHFISREIPTLISPLLRRRTSKMTALMSCIHVVLQSAANEL